MRQVTGVGRRRTQLVDDLINEIKSWELKSKTKIYKTVILLVVIRGCETWSLTLKEECRLRVFENKILRQLFELKRYSNREWRRLHNEGLHSMYRSPNIVRMIESR